MLSQSQTILLHESNVIYAPNPQRLDIQVPLLLFPYSCMRRSCDHRPDYLLRAFLFPAHAAPVPPPFSPLRFALPPGLKLHGFPGPVGEQCPPQLRLTGDLAIPGGAQGSI